jgi:hypothetical protein
MLDGNNNDKLNWFEVKYNTLKDSRSKAIINRAIEILDSLWL